MINKIKSKTNKINRVNDKVSYIFEKKISKRKEQLMVLLIGFLVVLPACLPLLRKEFFLMHDYTHVARLVELDRAINDGHFPVRWSKNLGFGYGMPMFNFYAPLAYYLAEVFYLIGFSFLVSIKMTFFLNYLVSFLGMYYLAKYFWGRLGGIISATAFVYAPYHAVDFYVRGALGELTAITFIPLALYGLLRLSEKKSYFWIAISSIFVSGVVLSHNLVALMAIPVIMLMGFVFSVYIKKPFKIDRLVRFFWAIGLGLGLSLFYFMPALAEKSFTRVESLTQGFSHYSHHFLYLRQFVNSEWGYGGSIFGLADNISFEIGKIHILLVALGFLSFVKLQKIKRKFAFIVIGVSGLVLIGSILMSTFKTKFIWDAIPLLAFLQFPWRFLSIIIVFVGFISGGVAFLIRKKKYKSFIFGFIVLALIGLNVSYFRPEKYLENTEDFYYSDAERIKAKMSGIIPDFIPSEASDSIVPMFSRFEVSYDGVVEGIDPIIDRTQEFLLRVDVNKPTEIAVNIFWFPGWKFFLDGESIDFEKKDSKAGPVMKLVLDPEKVGSGEHLISGKLTDTPVRKIGNIVSFLSLGIIIYLVSYEKFRRV